MSHFYESMLINTTDGIQCKTYANIHPDNYVIVKPKYIPTDLMDSSRLKHRFLFSKCMLRFNLFTESKVVNEVMQNFRKSLPDYVLEDKNHNNWFFVVPKSKIKDVPDARSGLRELMKVPYDDLDSYLKSTVDLVNILIEAGTPSEDIGIMHSTLLGNYTVGKSDIDLVVFGKKNGWKVMDFLNTVKHPKLRWKTEKDWLKYYTDRVVSKFYTPAEYVLSMVRKKDDGFIDNNVFSIFVVEKPDECWYSWQDLHEPIGVVKITANVSDDYNSIVRPGFYEIENSKIVKILSQKTKSGIDKAIIVKRLVTWSRPFVLQAKKGESIMAVGLLERVTTKKEIYYQLVIGYFDSFITGRAALEFMKVPVR